MAKKEPNKMRGLLASYSITLAEAGDALGVSHTTAAKKVSAPENMTIEDLRNLVKRCGVERADVIDVINAYI